jgi:hypothetical protein
MSLETESESTSAVFLRKFIENGFWADVFDIRQVYVDLFDCLSPQDC